MTTVLRQQAATSPDDVGAQLTAAFLAVKSATEAGEAATLVVHGPDLLGQGSLEGAAIATGFLGLMRAVVFEGGAKGWQVNVIAVQPDEAVPYALIDQITVAGLTGQFLTTSAAGLGRIAP